MSLRRIRSRQPVVWLCLLLTVVTGCKWLGDHPLETPPAAGPPAPRQIEMPDVVDAPDPVATNVTAPLTVKSMQEAEDWYLTLEEAIQITLSNSDVIRDIGGRVVSTPQGVASVYDVALQEINPITGVEAALSAFDAQVASSLFLNRDESKSFASFITQGIQTTTAQNDRNQFNFELSKQTATGTQFSLRNITLRNEGVRRSIAGPNDPPFSSTTPGQYDTAYEAEFRHPLLQGAGIDFNRIAGPNATVGNYNGIVLARLRTDIALADFEAAVRNLILDVETAYWQLYFAYRTFDAQTAAYQAALETWRTVQFNLEAGTTDVEREALTRANFYLIKANMQNALSGGPTGSGIVGVFAAERSLRQLMGIPASDGRLIRPADSPSSAERIFQWQESLDMALDRRVELRRQKWVVKQRQNELLAARNFLLSRLDLVGLYRWRGVGDDLLGSTGAYENLLTGELEGWQFGVQFSTPLGKRREHAAVRAAELQLARERAILRNQELTVSNDLSTRFAELDRAFAVARATFNRSVAERQRLRTAMEKYENGVELLEFVLEAQRNTAEADSEYYRALVAYNLAIANFHFARGTFLNYAGVRLSEGPWSPDAYRSYAHEFRRFKPRMNYCLMDPPRVSKGPYMQQAPTYEQREGHQEPTAQPYEVETYAPTTPAFEPPPASAAE